ncbi:MAG TPA: glycosyltransferase, partial [Streptomyces sp.]|nr:glycosyltransferase [Streptomyces sp.]
MTSEAVRDTRAGALAGAVPVGAVAGISAPPGPAPASGTPDLTSAHGGGGERPLNIAMLSYKGNPFCGGQGVYVRHLSRELARLGHSVEVIGAQPYPVLDEGVTLTELPSLDLYRQPDPFRTPGLREYRDWVDLLEVATMWTGGFPEPLTFSLRARRHLAARQGEFD